MAAPLHRDTARETGVNARVIEHTPLHTHIIYKHTRTYPPPPRTTTTSFPMPNALPSSLTHTHTHTQDDDAVGNSVSTVKSGTDHETFDRQLSPRLSVWHMIHDGPQP